MFRSLIVAAVLLSSVPALAFPSSFIGTWTTKKGDCRSAERSVIITPKSFKRYEEQCKIDRIDTIDVYGNKDYKLKMTCDQEGEMVKSEFIVSPQETADQIKYAEGQNGTHGWLFRCKN